MLLKNLCVWRRAAKYFRYSNATFSGTVEKWIIREWNKIFTGKLRVNEDKGAENRGQSKQWTPNKALETEERISLGEN